MKIIYLGIIVIAFLFSYAELYAATSSANYKISAEVLSAGAASGSSVSYQLHGILRERGLGILSSASFLFGGGFFRSIYFAPVIFGPLVTDIDPKTAANNQTVSLNISGANFVPGSSVKLSLIGEPDIIAALVTVVSTSRLIADLDIRNAKIGLWDVTVTVPDGRSSTLPLAFKITYPAPVVTAITPNKTYNTEGVTVVELTGNYFRAGAQVHLSKIVESNVPGENVVVESPNEITCRFSLAAKAVGLWDVNVTSDDGLTGTLPQGFKIEAPVLVVTEPVKSTANPFNPTQAPTKIQYSLSQDADIMIYVYNMRGELVWSWTAPAGSKGGQVGQNEVVWDGLTAFKSYVSSGVYILRVTAKIDGQIKELSRTKIAIIK